MKLSEARTEADLDRIVEEHAERTIRKAWCLGFAAGRRAALGEPVATAAAERIKACLEDLEEEENFSW